MSTCPGRPRSRLRLDAWTGLCIALGLAGCVPVWSRTFPVLEPVSPSVQLNAFREVDSLQPELRWKPAKVSGVTYDVVIWDSGLDPLKTRPETRFNWGTVVYQREDLSQNSHRVDTSLKRGTLYFWSVRTRNGSALGDWSTLEGWEVIGTAAGGFRREIHGAPFGFTTPP